MKTKTYDSIIDNTIECFTIGLHWFGWSLLMIIILCVCNFAASEIFETWQYTWSLPIIVGVVLALPFTFWSYAARRASQKFGPGMARDFWMAWSYGVKIERKNPGPDGLKIVDEMEEWIEENDLGLCRIKYNEKFYQAVFWNEEDALAFKIRWQQ